MIGRLIPQGTIDMQRNVIVFVRPDGEWLARKMSKWRNLERMVNRVTPYIDVTRNGRQRSGSSTKLGTLGNSVKFGCPRPKVPQYNIPKCFTVIGPKCSLYATSMMNRQEKNINQKFLLTSSSNIIRVQSTTYQALDQIISTLD
jgi:hypothetical protein